MADDGWRLGHRPSLDALRGLAVLGVVWAHSDPTVLAGAGSVGVDAFFALSGFLITRLLIEEQRDSGRISLRGFYERRARRLLPVLPVFVVVAATLSVLTLRGASHGIATALTYTTNYFPNGSGLFKHTWSLAVEEHFYMVWPAIVIACRSERRLVGVALALGVGSALLRIVETDPEMAYRATHLRADAILAGAVVAVVGIKWRPSILITAGAGMVMLWGATIERDTFSGWPASLVSIASCVVMLSVIDSERRLPPLERLGVISYGVYLFHYPISIVAREYTDVNSGWLFMGVLAASVASAEFSYRLIESPWRKRRPVVSDEVAVGVDGAMSRP